MWALLSGIEGNLAAYEAVLADLRRYPVSDLFILGDFIGPHPDCAALLARLQTPKPQELMPQCCVGWWEEQLLILHGLRGEGEPRALLEHYSPSVAKQLWDAVPRAYLSGLSQLHFGFLELDCFLIHGSSVSVEDELTPERSPLELLDRLTRVGAKRLFCGRSGRCFDLLLEGGQIRTTLETLGGTTHATLVAPSGRIVGVGSVGRVAGQATYALYSPETDQLIFREVRWGSGQGFGAGGHRATSRGRR